METLGRADTKLPITQGLRGQARGMKRLWLAAASEVDGMATLVYEICLGGDHSKPFACSECVGKKCDAQREFQRLSGISVRLQREARALQ